MTTDPNQDPRLSGQAQVGAAAGVNPNNVAPQGASLNQSQKAAVINIVANDAAKGANVYVRLTCLTGNSLWMGDWGVQ